MNRNGVIPDQSKTVRVALQLDLFKSDPPRGFRRMRPRPDVEHPGEGVEVIPVPSDPAERVDRRAAAGDRISSGVIAPRRHVSPRHSSWHLDHPRTNAATEVLSGVLMPFVHVAAGGWGPAERDAMADDFTHPGVSSARSRRRSGWFWTLWRLAGILARATSK